MHFILFLTSSICAGEAPESPVASIFSTFPDISPKKVSALHNVFVSPLRSNKVCKDFCKFHFPHYNGLSASSQVSADPVDEENHDIGVHQPKLPIF